MRLRVDTVRLFSQFVGGSIRQVLRGPAAYWLWLAFLLLLIGSGAGPTWARCRTV